jgi:alpha-L-fucosidase
MKPVAVCLLLGLLAGQAVAQTSLSQTQRLQWWRDSRLGLFIHWGPVSRIGKEISWSRNGYGKSRYDSLYLGFNPTRFNAREWVKLAKANGFKYIVLTAKHHDGFCLWNTKTTAYNIMSSPFGRDVCQELAQAAHDEGIRIGWYFSVADWHDPDCRNPKTNAQFADRALTQLRELLTNYGTISLLWIDYEGWPNPIQPKRVYDLARQINPQIIINNRLEPFTPDESHAYLGQYADYTTPEGFVAGYGAIPWETCTNMGHQWAWRFGDSPRPLTECVQTLLRCVGGNGNLLFNIGPDSTGVFPAPFVERTRQMGNWLNRHAEAIYQTQGGPYTPTQNYVSTYRGQTVYVHWLAKTGATAIRLPALPATVRKATLLNGTPVVIKNQSADLQIIIPESGRDSVATIVALTLDRPAATLGQIRPFTTSHSLAYNQKARASSALGQFLHDASAAVDDNPATFWKMGRRPEVNFAAYYGQNIHYLSDSVMNLFQHTGWLEVDLGKPLTVGRLVVSEWVDKRSSIKGFAVQHWQDGYWLTLAEGTDLGNWSTEISPVTGQKFRLVIKDSVGYPGIREFQVFDK